MSAAYANATFNNYLDTILKSRLQRKAKTIVMSSLQFLAVDIALRYAYLNVPNKDTIEPVYDVGFQVTLYIGAAYVVLLAGFIFMHATCVLKTTNMQTKSNVEKAYENTNIFPVIDALLELPFPFLFKGILWYLPYFFWIICLGLITVGALFFHFTSVILSAEMISTLTAAALLLYQITSDFSEYWVQSRNMESTDDEVTAKNEA